MPQPPRPLPEPLPPGWGTFPEREPNARRTPATAHSQHGRRDVRPAAPAGRTAPADS